MTSRLSYAFHLVTLVLLQAVLFNNISIAGIVNIYIYVYFILMLPMKTGRSALLWAGFGLGIVMDLFSGTLGIHAAATTLTAFLRPYVLSLYASQEEQEKYAPALKYIGGSFVKYAVTLVFIHHFTLFALSAFSLHFLGMALLKAVASGTVTSLIIIAVERLKK